MKHLVLSLMLVLSTVFAFPLETFAQDIPDDDGSGHPVVLGDNETLGYELEGTRIPHFFVYDPVSQVIFHTFVPDQSDLNAIQIYLSTVLSRYKI